MEKEETIGFHKGSLSTLIKEREELSRIISIVDQLIQAHQKALSDLGVNLEKKSNQVEEKENRTP